MGFKETLAKLDCGQVSDHQWEELGKAVMDEMHPSLLYVGIALNLVERFKGVLVKKDFLELGVIELAF